jgi:hypothetical protein
VRIEADARVLRIRAPSKKLLSMLARELVGVHAELGPGYVVVRRSPAPRARTQGTG